jgi:hypothetical protein
MVEYDAANWRISVLSLAVNEVFERSELDVFSTKQSQGSSKHDDSRTKFSKQG